MANLAKKNQMSPWVDFFDRDNFFDHNWLKKWDQELPAVNISESEKQYSLEVVAPGFKKEDFRLKVDDDVLSISAEAKSETGKANAPGKDYTRREYSYSSFTRSFRLPDNVKDDHIKASYREGVLHIDLPKSTVQQKATKEISVE